MSWVIASLISAFFLGVYDLCKKHAVHANAVVPVLFLSTACAALVWIVLLGAQMAAPVSAWPTALRVDPLSWSQHALLFLKSLIVGSSWVCSYVAVKHLPVSLGSPIRATGPLWTLLGALLVLGERPSLLEAAGIATTLISFVGLSFAGSREGIHFHRNRWVGWMFAATLLGALSGLYDKHLLGSRGFSAATVQAWFCIYLVVLFLPLAFGWWRRWWPRNEFTWRWSIPGIAAGLLIADFVYFDALRDPDALVSLVSSIRRGSTLVAFAGGLWLFKEKNGGAKLPAVLGIVAGIALTVMG